MGHSPERKPIKI